MALLWVEGFEAFGSSSGNIAVGSGLVQKYAHTDAGTAGVMKLVDGAYSTGCAVYFRLGSTLYVPSLTNCSTIITGFNYYTYGAGMVADRLVCNICPPTLDGATSSYLDFGLYITANGADLATKLRDGTLTNCVTLDVPLTNNTWYHFEVKCFRDASGTLVVNLDGAEVMNVSTNTSSLTTYFNSYPTISWHTLGTANSTFYLDNVYVCDTVGSTCNDFLGQCRVVTMYPSGDASGNWTANSGSYKFAMVDQVNLDTTNYIKETTTGNQQLFNYSANVNGGTILGVQVNTDCALSANLIKGIKHVSQNSTGNINTHNAYPVGLALTNTVTDVFCNDPDGNPFTNATLNGTHYGVKVA